MAEHTPESRSDRRRWWSGNVLALGIVSLLNDTATEMALPLLPVFLTTVVGAGPVALGLIEGAANATASVLKLVSGRWSDRIGRNKPFVIAGYSLSSLVRPLLALATSATGVAGVRIADRVGKGLRTSPRDALLAASARSSHWARAFSLHRAMDHTGAMLGPLIAFLVLSYWTDDLRTLFWLTAVPGVLVILAVLFVVREAEAPEPEPEPAPEPSAAGAGTRRRLARLLTPIGLFTLGNASDTFLLLRASEERASLTTLPLLWLGLHAVRTVTSPIGGSLADRLGRRSLITVGWLLYAAVYLGFGLAESQAAIVALFLIYGAYDGLSEGAEKALVAEAAPREGRGTAFGWYHLTTGFGSLAASVLFGTLWQFYGSFVAFATASALALTATVLLWLLVPGSRPSTRKAPSA